MVPRAHARRRLAPLACAVVYDINGREADECAVVLDAIGAHNIQQYIFCSSAGVYKKSDQMPHREEDEVDFKSRHKVGSGSECWRGVLEGWVGWGMSCEGWGCRARCRHAPCLLTSGSGAHSCCGGHEEVVAV